MTVSLTIAMVRYISITKKRVQEREQQITEGAGLRGSDRRSVEDNTSPYKGDRLLSQRAAITLADHRGSPTSDSPIKQLLYCTVLCIELAGQRFNKYLKHYYRLKNTLKYQFSSKRSIAIIYFHKYFFKKCIIGNYNLINVCVQNIFYVKTQPAVPPLNFT